MDDSESESSSLLTYSSHSLSEQSSGGYSGLASPQHPPSPSLSPSPSPQDHRGPSWNGSAISDSPILSDDSRSVQSVDSVDFFSDYSDGPLRPPSPRQHDIVVTPSPVVSPEIPALVPQSITSSSSASSLSPSQSPRFAEARVWGRRRSRSPSLFRYSPRPVVLHDDLSSPEAASGSDAPRNSRPPSRASPSPAERDYGYEAPPLGPRPRGPDLFRLHWPSEPPRERNQYRPDIVPPGPPHNMGDRSQLRRDDDELVEVRFEEYLGRNGPRGSANQPVQVPDSPPRDRHQPEFIDLTEEPDSPVLEHRPAPRIQAASRNPRRQMSQNRRTPSLARSDGSILVERAVIDLTDESLEEMSAPHDARRRNPADRIPRPPPPPQLPQAHAARQSSPEVAFMGIFAQLENIGQAGFFRNMFAGNHRPRILNHNHNHIHRHNHAHAGEMEIIGLPAARPRPADVMDNPLQGNPVEFNYRINGWADLREPTPKPPHEPPPPAREGFTRNTGEDVVVVCASCEEELAYDPDAAADDGPPAKRARTRKDREEHHFWALPACGHVYCRHCYENRTNTGKRDKNKCDTLHFRPEGKNLLCAVDDCKTDVKPKKAWIGIFL